MLTSDRLIDKVDDRLRSLLFGISPRWLVQYRYLRSTGRWFRAGSARTFDEKLLWMMLYWRHPLKSRCADKYAVRSYVEEAGLGHLLAPLVGVYDSAAEIDFGALPDRFVLKTTHASQLNIICGDKSRLDPVDARRKLDAWLATDISWLAGELHYASIPPRIVCEAYLEDAPGKRLNDYKIYCFHGTPHCTMACTDRTDAGANYNVYDVEWRRKLPYFKSSEGSDRRIEKPPAYEEMLGAAAVLAKPFPFVRADFYSVGGRAVFGELTFTPHGCIDTDMTGEAQRTMGRLLTLPEKLL